MTIKQKELRKKLIKNILLKTLHIICYILSVLFILVAVVSGVQSCSKKQVNNKLSSSEIQNLVPLRNKVKVRNVNIVDNFAEYTYSYRQKYSDIFTLSGSWYIDLANHFNVPTGWTTDVVGTRKYGQAYTGQQFCVYKSPDSYFYPDTVTFVFSVYSSGENNIYRLSHVVAGFQNSFWDTTLIYKTQDSPGNFEYTYNGGYQLLFSNDVNFNETSYFLYFYEGNQITSFTFNKVFNYNAPLRSTIESVYGTGSFTSVSAYGSYNDYDVGYFISNGMIFNKIRIHYYNSAWVYVNNEIVQMPSDNYTYAMLEYVNTDTSSAVAVNVRDKIPYIYNGGSSFYFANSSTWYNDSFRNIIFLETLSQDLILKINSFNNNNQYGVYGYVGSGETTDVFTLLSFGFNSLTDFWSLQILPGISLGVLFFLPLVVSIIVIIIHLLRK